MTLTKITSKSIKDNEIVNADLHSAAAIAKSKLASLDIVNADINASAAIASTKLAKPIDLADNEKIRLGTSQDLEVFHDGSNSFIRDLGTGVLTLDTNGSKIQLMADGTSSKTLANFIKDGAVELYHNGTKKFETASTGLYGHTFMPSSNGGYDLGANATRWREVYIKDSGKIRLGDSDDLQIYHDASNSYLTNDTGNLFIMAGGGTAYLQAVDNENAVKVYPNAQVELYYNGELRFSTTDNGAKLENNGADDTDVLFLVENERDDSESDSVLRLRVSNGSANSRIEFGDAGNMDTGMIDYHHSNNRMRHHVDATDVWQTRVNGICPSSSGKNCGFSNASNRWADVRSSNFGGSSDRNEKNTIVTSDLGLDFINKLKPVSFKWNDGVAGRTHYGLVAQDVEDLLPDFGKTAMDFAALCKDTFTEDDEGNSVTPYDVYSLRYMEFISPLVKAIQELTAKVAALEAA